MTNSGAYNADVNNLAGGSITNTGIWTGSVLSNANAITNNGTWTGNVVSNTGTVTNNLLWNGSIANAGTFVNSANGIVSGG